MIALGAGEGGACYLRADAGIKAARSHLNPHPNNGARASKTVQASTMYILRCGYTKLQPLQAVFTQPTQVLSLGLISEA